MFSKFAKWLAYTLGHANAFVIAFLIVIIWLLSGPFFNYSDAWQLVISSVTNIITFFMVFILQNTQIRDTTAVHLKLDEILRSLKHAHHSLLKIEELPDEELEKLEKHYQELAKKIKEYKVK